MGVAFGRTVVAGTRGSPARVWRLSVPPDPRDEFLVRRVELDPAPPQWIDRQLPGSAQPTPVASPGHDLQDPVRHRGDRRLPAIPGGGDALPSARGRAPVRLRAPAGAAADGAPVLPAAAVLRPRLAEFPVA